MKITTRLQIAFVTICLFVAVTIALINYVTSRDLIIKESFDNLTVQREIKKLQILDYFDDIENHALTLAHSHTVIDATEKLHEAFHQIGAETQDKDPLRQSLLDYYAGIFGNALAPDLMPQTMEGVILQHGYIAANPWRDVERENLERSDQQHGYDRSHATFQPYFREYIKRFGFDDLLLADEDGHIIYSVVKSRVFATNLLAGPYRSSHIAEAFRRLKASPGTGPVLIDFARFEPDHGAPAAFIAAPILKKDMLLGVLILQIPIQQINEVMTNNYSWTASGLGQSGETYLVGSDFTMRSDSRFLIQEPERHFTQLLATGMPVEQISEIRRHGTSVLLHHVQTAAVQKALAGDVNTEIITDYRGVEVLSSYAPVKIGDATWAIVAEMDTGEAFAALDRLALYVAGVTVLIALGLLFAGNRFSARFTAPIKQLVRGVNDVGSGNFSQRIMIESKDEIGELAQQFNEMSATLGLTTISKDYLDGILSSLPDALFVVECTYGLSLTIQHINPASASLFGAERELLIGRNTSDFFLQEPLFTEEEWERLLAERHLSAIEKKIERTSGEHIPVEISASLLSLHHSGSTARHEIVCIAHDITQRKAYEAKIRHLADYDHLTGLTSRRLFHERLVQALGQAQRYSRKLALLYIDLDGFKFVNDTLGHDAGDELLVEVARRLSLTLRESDIVGRQGGDEFTIIMPEITDRLEVIIVAQKILTALQRPFDIHNERVRISATIGIALAPTDATDPDRLMKRADEAMFQAKRAGKACFHFASTDDHVSPAQTRLI